MRKHLESVVLSLVLIAAAAAPGLADDQESPPAATPAPRWDAEVEDEAPRPARLPRPAALADEPLLTREEGAPPTPHELERLLGAQGQRLAACADAEHGRRPEWLGTTLTAEATLSPDGRISQARVGDLKLERSPLGSCVRNVLEAVAFPPFSGEALTIEIPVVLRRTGAR